MPNMILLCGHHHRLIHASPGKINTTSPGHFAFEPPAGRRGNPRPPPDG